MNLRIRLFRLCTLVLALLCLAPAVASAELAIAPGSVVLETVDSAGAADNRAGIHPDRFVESFKTVNTGGSPEDPKEIVVDLPAGLGGDIGAVPFCSQAALHNFGPEVCPSQSQVGVLWVSPTDQGPIFNLKPGPNEVATFGAPIKKGSGYPLLFFGHLRTADQGISLRLVDIPEKFSAVTEFKIELWGVPADHQVGTTILRRPLLSTPSLCGSPLSGDVHLRTWEHPDRWISQTGTSGQPLVGCNALPFDPKVDFSLDSPRADVASGALFDLDVPQSLDPDGYASAQLKDLSIEMPEGMAISPAGAVALKTCSDDQFALGTSADAACPAGSRVGGLELAASALSDDSIKGSLYLGQEHRDDRFRLLTVANFRGSQLKFLGSLRANPRTGRLTTSLSNLPQASFDYMSLRFDGGPHALLATPLACGPAKTLSSLTPFSGGPAVKLSATVAISGADGGPGCSGPPPFAPTFTGGSTSAAGGRATSFRTVLSRKDGEQLPDRVEVTLPPGMSAALAGIGSCASADAATGKCPAGSRIGEAAAELGPGEDSASLDGDIYLTGPYRGTPFGLALVFKAAIGPVDLGTLVIRGAMRLDSRTAQLTVALDPLPRLFEGISVRFQTIGLELDRPGFLHNPTSCTPSSLASSVSSITGQKSHTDVPFRVQGCVNLPFRPDFAMALSGRSQLRDGGKPGLRISTRVPSGGANLRSTDISLPRSLAFDSSGVAELCARRDAISGKCPKGARVGSASVRTPLFDRPLKGSIYVAQPRGGGQPDLWTHFERDGLSLDMKSSASKEDGQLHTTLTDLPDVRLSKLTLRFVGGEQGLFSLDRDLCRGSKSRKLASEAVSEGQNGARVLRQVPVIAQPKCG